MYISSKFIYKLFYFCIRILFQPFMHFILINTYNFVPLYFLMQDIREYINLLKIFFQLIIN